MRLVDWYCCTSCSGLLYFYPHRGIFSFMFIAGGVAPLVGRATGAGNTKEVEEM